MTGNSQADEAWERLLAGNRRYVTGARAFPDQTFARRQELVAGQKPFAAILTCSDSRVVPEIIFDQGLGNLFVVRVAGNIVDDALCGSLVYAVEHLSVPLILVLGHSGCGAVQLVLAGGPQEESLEPLVAKIKSAVELARSEPGPLLENAVRANVVLAVGQLRSAAGLATCAAKGNLEILGALYDLASGTVTLLEPCTVSA